MSTQQPKARLFLSYGRRDASELAGRLVSDLEAAGYHVWQDTRSIRAGNDWQSNIVDGLRSTQLVVALLSPHAVRSGNDPSNQQGDDSVCLDELTFARFTEPPKHIVPVMAIPCEPPFCIFRLDYVDMHAWRDSEDQYATGFARLLDSIDAAMRNQIRYRDWDFNLQPWILRRC